MPIADIYIFIPKGSITKGDAESRGLQITEDTESGFIVRTNARNRYRGDDETIVFELYNDHSLDGVEEWRVLWDKSSY